LEDRLQDLILQQAQGNKIERLSDDGIINILASMQWSM
jgi:hypothetical protein